MDMKQVSKINRDALEAAKRSVSSGRSRSRSLLDKFERETGTDDHEMIGYVVGLVVAVGVYLLLNHYKPEFVMKRNQQGKKEVCQMRLVLSALLAGVVAYVVYEASVHN